MSDNQGNQASIENDKLRPLLDAIETMAFPRRDDKLVLAVDTAEQPPPKKLKANKQSTASTEVSFLDLFLQVQETCPFLPSVISCLQPHEVVSFFQTHPAVWRLRDKLAVWRFRLVSALRHFHVHADDYQRFVKKYGSSQERVNKFLTDLLTVADCVMRRLYGKSAHALHRALWAHSKIAELAEEEEEEDAEEIPEPAVYRRFIAEQLKTGRTRESFLVTIGSDAYMDDYDLAEHREMENCSKANRLAQGLPVWVYLYQHEDGYELYGIQGDRGKTVNEVGGTGRQSNMSNESLVQFYVLDSRLDDVGNEDTNEREEADVHTTPRTKVCRRLTWLDQRGFLDDPAICALLPSSLAFEQRGSQLATPVVGKDAT